MNNQYFYSTDDSKDFTAAPDVYALGIALEKWLQDTLGFTPDRIVYANDNYCFRERTKLTKSNTLELPFLNYHSAGFADCGRQWFNNTSNLFRHQIGDLNLQADQKIKTLPIRVNYSGNLFFNQDFDKEVAAKKLLYAASNETFITYTLRLSNGIDIELPAVVDVSIDADPEYDENEQLQKNDIFSISFDIGCDIMMIIGTGIKVSIAEDFALDFLVAKNHDNLMKWIGIEEYFDRSNPYTYLNKVKDFLYEIHYDDYDYTYANEVFKSKYFTYNGGACSGLRKGNYIGRNFDWFYQDDNDFMVKVPAKEGRFASIGIASSSGLTLQDLDNRIYDPKYKLIPFLMVDGINEKGVCVSIYVAPKDKGNTHQTEEGKQDLCALMIPRLVLDKCETALEACNLIKEYNVYCLPSYEFHFLIADESETYVVEFIDNVTTITSPSKPLITNFHLDGTTVSGNQLNWNTVEDYGQGLERYQLMLDNYDRITKENGVWNLMKMLYFSKAYTNPVEEFWKTEFTNSDREDRTIHMDVDDLDLDLIRSLWTNRSRDKAKVWHTVHTCVYNIAERSLNVVVQEQTKEDMVHFELIDSNGRPNI